MENRFFDAHQRETVLSAMARIIPTDHEPGAREAGTIEFLDRYLSGIDFIYAKPDGSGFETLQGRQAEAWRTRIAKLREIYRDGIADLDRRSRAAFGEDFAALAPERQDGILVSAERSEPDPPGEQSSTSTAPAYALSVAADPAGAVPALQQTSTETELPFVPLLVLHTRQGFYADPIYGGNRGQVGWRVIGFPGPASLADVFTGRYSTIEYFAEGHNRPPEEHGGGE
jgi:gluconate 2-dehydrogenase gamma chain